MIILFKERSSIKKDKSSIHLAIGLVFWFIANIIWGYYEIILDVVSPVPSLADVFLLSAYGFLIYRLIITYKNLSNVTNKKAIYFVAVATGLFLIYILNLTLSLSEISNFRGLMLFIVTLAYPTLNSILTILALSILLNISKERHHVIPWICELVGLLAIVIGDSWFAVIVLTAFVEQIWISAVLISAHYLLIAGGLVWYLRHYSKWNSKWTNSKSIGRIKITSKKKIIFSIIVLMPLIGISSLYFSGVLIASENGESSSYSLSHSQLFINGNDNPFLVGAIVPQSGSLSSIRKPVVIALEKAEYDVNKYFENKNSSSRVMLIIENSKTSPEGSVSAIKQLYAAGARIIVGPATSTAVSAVKDFAENNNITLLSYASTFPKLSIKGDNLLRLVPDDRNQAKIIAEKMVKDGVKVVVPFWRGDIYGNELSNATKYYFEKLGGIVKEGVNYEPFTGKFATSLHRINFIMRNQELKKLNVIVTDAISKYGPNAVAVYIVSFDEITPILIQSQLFDNLLKVRWYGSDSIAENHHIVKNTDSANFAIQTKFKNPLFAVDTESEKPHEFEKALENKYHETSLTYPAVAYDSF